MKTQKTYDLSFIGAGLSCSYTLIHLMDLAQQGARTNPCKVLIIDKAGEFWTGIPYGNRSGYESLIITSLKEFLTASELACFIAWLKQNYEKKAARVEENGPRRYPSWIVRNKAAIAAGQWEKIFIPRYLFGVYLRERMKLLLERAVAAGILEYDLAAADVTNVETLDKGYAITANNGEEAFVFNTKKVVLAIGSPPKKCLNNLRDAAASPFFIEDIYEPGLEQNVKRIKEYVEGVSGKAKNILLLGSNASALETVYNLCNTVDLNRIRKLYVISPDGAFPNRIEEETLANDYQPLNLLHLSRESSYTSAQILEAVKMDTEAAQKENLSVSDIYQMVSATVVALMNNLDYEEQKKFVCNDGVEIGKFQRRAGSEYLRAVDELQRHSKLAFIKGRFAELVDRGNGQFAFEYHDGITGQNKVFSAPPDVVVNCIGSQELSHSSSELIRSLVRQKICVVNGSKRGFEVNGNFEASNGFFVMGPLLAGNLNEKIRVWHAESCPRIFSLSRLLAEELVRTME